MFTGRAIFKFSFNSFAVQLKAHLQFETDKFDTEDEQTTTEDEQENSALTQDENIF